MFLCLPQSMSHLAHLAGFGFVGHMTADNASVSVAKRRADILERMEAACRRAGREESSAELVAVSKVQPDDRIDAALTAGQRFFGENRVQEAVQRWQYRKPAYPDLSLHLIGPLQTNKAALAGGLFDMIETLDRPKLARALAALDQPPPCLIQVNTGFEPQKAGILPDGLPALLGEAQTLGLRIEGLMCIPPVNEPAGAHFAFLSKLAIANRLRTLSMGMSADFETAIAFGATHVRVGSALFGDRQKRI